MTSKTKFIIKDIIKDITNIIQILIKKCLVSVYKILINNNRKIKIEQVIINFLFNLISLNIIYIPLFLNILTW